MDIKAAPDKPVDILQFREEADIAEVEANKRITAALRVFIGAIAEGDHVVEKIDKTVLDQQIAAIDEKISAQLDAILHHPEFQKLESSWKGLKFLVDRTDFRKNIKIEVLDISKQALLEDFEDSPETIQTGMYKHIYTQEYDTPGGEPVGAIISNYEFSSKPQDISLLQNVSKISASAHCPFIGSVGAQFFNRKNASELPAIEDLANYMERAEYLKWKAFRESEDSRYVGLVLPRFLLRLPYGPDTIPVKEFVYKEKVTGDQHDKYLWGNATFSLAANLARSFADNGWCVQIRGPEAGGKVEDLPIHLYDVGKGNQMKIPTEILIPETREFEFANQGFIPLSFYKNRNYACFFSANSTQKAQLYDDPNVTANSRINARLPYIFLSSRLAHYLKVIQRENIGATKNASVLQDELNNWIKNLVTEMKNPSPAVAAQRPLSAAEVKVAEIADNPGFYRVTMAVSPHFQVEGIDVNLQMVSQMPKGK
ncbi:MAG: type VI secretion system contractile sheath large subunit [Fibrobacterota bacterium]|nr:type VI secretion system contractile sheath large subunit [Fibrobacterota bacterium]